MTEFPATKLSDKEIVSSDGDELGKIYNITANLKTGKLKDLVVDPKMGVDKSEFETEDDFILIPFESVKAIKDMVVVEI
ncbi:photosystem reaction center subunit H [archaeon SCG-AAA382B04]|nr:photosystem reaction center subunit H [archaeon SCG-AAA382B04]